MTRMSYLAALVFCSAASVAIAQAQPPTTPTTQQPAPGQVTPPQPPTQAPPTGTVPAPTTPQPAATQTMPAMPSQQPLGGSTPAMTPPQMPDAGTHLTDEHRTMMLMLLDRIQKLSTPPADSKAGKVSVD